MARILYKDEIEFVLATFEGRFLYVTKIEEKSLEKKNNCTLTGSAMKRSSTSLLDKNEIPCSSVEDLVEEKAQPALNLTDSVWYLNRELTWLEFNRRVLHEAEDERVPLLERVKFLAIASANLDRFFMKRIGGLKQQIYADINELTLDGRTPREQVQQCYTVIQELEAHKKKQYSRVHSALKEKNIIIETYSNLEKKEKKELYKHYCKNIFPRLTPQSLDFNHSFPFISNLSLNLLVTVRFPNSNQISLMSVNVPAGQGTPRFLRLGKGDCFITLEEVISNNLDMLFPASEILSWAIFRVTRSSNTEKDEEETDDLMALIESEVKERTFAPIVRLEISEGISPKLRGRLAAAFGLDNENDIFENSCILAMRDLFELSRLEFPQLHDLPYNSVDHPMLQSQQNIFHIIRDVGSILLQHPYESFSSSVERLLREAATDPKVRGIKMTLYRTAAHSCIVEALVQAAQNGKQVAVVVELKARFDETANIKLAEKMEEVGIHVTYGVVGLKTHCKVIMIVRQDYSGIRRYVHIGTGNYHENTARIYSDIGLLTCDKAIGQDVSELFNYLTTGFKDNRKYEKLYPSPHLLKSALLSKIERETVQHADGGGGLIQFKMNALEDGDIVRALYRASMAGVRVDLVVRDICRLRPGIPGLSENIRVISIVGRFLEHAKIYYFRNGGMEEYFIASADAMKRNLEARVEILCPVENHELENEIRAVFDINLSDQYSAWDMQSDGTYVQRRPADTTLFPCGSHQKMINNALERSRNSHKEKHSGLHDMEWNEY